MTVPSNDEMYHCRPKGLGCWQPGQHQRCSPVVVADQGTLISQFSFGRAKTLFFRSFCLLLPKNKERKERVGMKLLHFCCFGKLLSVILTGNSTASYLAGIRCCDVIFECYGYSYSFSLGAVWEVITVMQPHLQAFFGVLYCVPSDHLQESPGPKSQRKSKRTQAVTYTPRPPEMNISHDV